MTLELIQATNILILFSVVYIGYRLKSIESLLKNWDR